MRWERKTVTGGTVWQAKDEKRYLVITAFGRGYGLWVFPKDVFPEHGEPAEFRTVAEAKRAAA